MGFSLYDASVANYLQMLAAVSAFLDRGLSHCEENDISPEEIVETRLFPDMLPFRFQVVSVAHHSRGAIEGIQNGSFAPFRGGMDLKYAALQAMVTEARETLSAITPDAVNGLIGRDVVFQSGERKMPFTAEEFLMSFSLPNFYFHAATAYDILRHKGVPLGKRDFMGRVRMKS